MGGDEFLLLVADMDRPPAPQLLKADVVPIAEALAARIHDSLKPPFVLEGTEVYISTSIGISVYPYDANDAAALLKHADAAMYRSKKEGPGGSIFFADESSSPMTKLSLSTRLRKAVDGRQWVLHYQPIVDLVEGRPIGVEALLRWMDPDNGMIAPGEFIPLAEEMGLIDAIGDWVIEELARQTRQWTDAGLVFDVSFNLSARQLWQPDLVGAVLGRLENEGVDPRSVVIEITESAATTNLERTQKVLWELHRGGVRIAMDDFGTGYSSLNRLKHLPVDVLKIDRAFIRDLPEKEAGSMVRAIVQLAGSLQMQPLAEGIETEEQWEFIVQQGCNLGQGFLFSRAVPAEEITALFASGVPFRVPDLTT